MCGMGKGDPGHLWLAGVQLDFVCPPWASSPEMVQEVSPEDRRESKEAGGRHQG